MSTSIAVANDISVANIIRFHPLAKITGRYKPRNGSVTIRDRLIQTAATIVIEPEFDLEDKARSCDPVNALQQDLTTSTIPGGGERRQAETWWSGFLAGHL